MDKYKSYLVLVKAGKIVAEKFVRFHPKYSEEEYAYLAGIKSRELFRDAAYLDKEIS